MFSKQQRLLAYDYRGLRLNTLISEKYRHLLLLLYWPIYGLSYIIVERLIPVEHYTPIYCPLDDLIPFCEWFLIPYVFWYVFIFGMLIFTLRYDIPGFRKFMKYIIFTYSVATVIYLIFPNCQQLRPTEFERNNLLTRITAGLYWIDTNTNVCPSIHVLGSVAVMEAALYSDVISNKRIKLSLFFTGIIICLSTMFMKQHSVLDNLAAIPVCLVAHFLCYGIKLPRKHIQDWFYWKRQAWILRDTYRFYRCKQCKKMMRVPKGKGKIKITCPQCHSQIIKKT